MGSSVGAKKKKEEEKNEDINANDKTKKLVPRDIFQENESQKDKKTSQSKLLNTKSDKLTNPIINKNNLQPGLDISLSRQNQISQIENDKMSLPKKNFMSSQILPNDVKLETNDDKKDKDKDKDKNDKNKKDKDKKDKEKEEKEKYDLLPNEKLIRKGDENTFPKTMTQRQLKNLENYNKTYTSKGEHIFISLGDTFNIFNDFYSNLSAEHKLYDEHPIYNFHNFIEETSKNYTARGIAFNIPNDLNDLYRESDINSLFRKDSIIFNSFKRSRTRINPEDANKATLQEFLNINENSKDFIKEYNNNSSLEKLSELLRAEAEKADNFHCLHFIGDIFDGSSMGILCNMLNNLEDKYEKVLKLVHLKYYDSFEHRAFNKIKNYIYTVSNLYNKCNLVNFFNTPKGGQILSCMTVGERIPEYEESYSINQILSDLLVEPKLNYIYSNGVELKEKDCNEKYIELLFQDCKEDRGHKYYKAQMSSLAIYRGNKQFNINDKVKLGEEMSKIIDIYIKNNRSYYNLYDINKNFDICDFITNLHQSRYFNRFTEEYFMDFIQNYNMRNFSNEEKELKEETITNTYGLLNNFKEIWKLEV